MIVVYQMTNLNAQNFTYSDAEGNSMGAIREVDNVLEKYQC